MDNLIDIIRYDHKNYRDVDFEGRQEIGKLVAKLKLLENEIIDHPKGVINIMKSGDVFTTGFPSELAEKISMIVMGR